MHVLRRNRIRVISIVIGALLATVPALALFLVFSAFLVGGLDAFLKQNTNIYNVLVTSAFTLAGFTLATATFMRIGNRFDGREREMRRNLLLIAVILLASGFLMYFNLIAGGISVLNSNPTGGMLTFFTISLYLGSGGLILFAIGLESLIVTLGRTYVDLVREEL